MIELPSDARSVDGFPGYAVDPRGNVWSKRKQLKPGKGKGGHLYVCLFREKKEHWKYVHQLVCEAFNGKCPDGLECRHLDGNPSNNTPGNLKWGTRLENCADTLLHGTRPTGNKHGSHTRPESVRRGSKNSLAKLSESDVYSVHEMSKNGASKEQIAKQFAVHRSQISRILNGKTWRHVTHVPAGCK